MSSMIKQHHMKDLCVRHLNFHLSLLKAKPLQAIEKHVPCAKNGFIRVPILFHNCIYCKSIVFVLQRMLTNTGQRIIIFFIRNTVGILCYSID